MSKCSGCFFLFKFQPGVSSSGNGIHPFSILFSPLLHPEPKFLPCPTCPVLQHQIHKLKKKQTINHPSLLPLLISSSPAKMMLPKPCAFYNQDHTAIASGRHHQTLGNQEMDGDDRRERQLVLVLAFPGAFPFLLIICDPHSVNLKPTWEKSSIKLLIMAEGVWFTYLWPTVQRLKKGIYFCLELM